MKAVIIDKFNEARSQVRLISAPLHSSILLQALTDLWNKFLPKGQALQAAGQSHILHALVEIITHGQAIQAAGQSYVLHALIKHHTKSQVLQTAGQSHILHALIEAIPKGHTL